MLHYFQVITVVWRLWWLGEQMWTWTFLTWAQRSIQPASAKSWSVPGNSWGKVSLQHSVDLYISIQTGTCPAWRYSHTSTVIVQTKANACTLEFLEKIKLSLILTRNNSKIKVLIKTFLITCWCTLFLSLKLPTLIETTVCFVILLSSTANNMYSTAGCPHFQSISMPILFANFDWK